MAGSEMVKKHIKALQAMNGKIVEAGWFATNVDAKGVPIAYRARINEFGGTAHQVRNGKEIIIIIPPRPFMRLAFKNFTDHQKALQKRLAKRLFSGKITADQVLAQIGQAMEVEIIDSIKNGGWQANAPSTIARKGFDSPLIHVGTMWQTVISKVS